jgi:hypothetical protein
MPSHFDPNAKSCWLTPDLGRRMEQGQLRGTKLPFEMESEAAHRRAVVRRSDLSDWHFMAAKHILSICQTLQKPNRRAGGRPVMS